MFQKIHYYLPIFISLIFIQVLAFTAVADGAVQTTHILLDSKSKTTIVLPQNATLAEQTAAHELNGYLTQITGGTFSIQAENVAVPTPVAIFVGDTQFAKRFGISKSTLASEEWRIKTQNHNLILCGGGPRGTLYATYHFLEDVCGVHWWNPWEETVPKQKVLSISALDKSGQPAFAYRNIYATYGNDGGRFAIRSRLNGNGDGGIVAEYGGSVPYGPPYFVHTSYYPIYISPEKYYPAHPDWFIGNGNDAPTVANSQLAMSNPEMRKEFLKLLIENIRTSRQAAINAHLPLPKVYDVSQNDNTGIFVAGTEDEALVKANGGAESAIVLSFINYLADGIKDEFPDVFISTLAYGRTELPPTNMNAHDNVIITLCDTHSNVLLPITAERNTEMREHVEGWAKHSEHLRIWDYDIVYGLPHLPAPTMQTYPVDLQFFLKHNVQGMFIEFEEPLESDMRDLKFWVLCKLLEDPNQNYDALVQEFTDGFYGLAGPYVRQYLATLQAAAKGSNADLFGIAGLPAFTYLNLDFLQKSDRIFTSAASAVKGNPVLSQRVRDARSPVDDAILRSYQKLTQEWVDAGHTPESMPLNRDEIAQRFRQTRDEQINLRLPEAARGDALKQANTTIDNLMAVPAYIPIPAKFKDVPADQLFVYNPQSPTIYGNLGKVIEDPQAESGFTLRCEIPDGELDKYKTPPMVWGVYDRIGRRVTSSGAIKADDIPAAGYHWYKLGDATLTGHDYFYFFWSWQIQNDLNDAYDAKMPNAKFEIWVNLKFEGSDFPYGQAGDKNAISVDRIVLVKKGKYQRN